MAGSYGTHMANGRGKAAEQRRYCLERFQACTAENAKLMFGGLFGASGQGGVRIGNTQRCQLPGDLAGRCGF